MKMTVAMTNENDVICICIVPRRTVLNLSASASISKFKSIEVSTDEFSIEFSTRQLALIFSEYNQ